MTDPILQTTAVTKTFRQRDGSTLTAVDQANIAINGDESVALVGESGSGKSTLARLALRLTSPDSGAVLFFGQPLHTMKPHDLKRYRRAVQAVFQDPAATFNPRRTVRNSLYQALRQAETPGRSLAGRAVDLLQQVRLTPPEDLLDRYPHDLSGGQRQRLAIARALALEPRLIIADEPLSGADASIRGQILNLLSDLQRQRHVAYLLITHDISLARAFSQRVAVMYRGRIVEEGRSDDVLTGPRHPYTRLLLASAPSVDGGLDLGAARSTAPRPHGGGGCVFYSRCPIANDSICPAVTPELRELAPSHRAACHLAERDV